MENKEQIVEEIQKAFNPILDSIYYLTSYHCEGENLKILDHRISVGYNMWADGADPFALMYKYSFKAYGVAVKIQPPAFDDSDELHESNLAYSAYYRFIKDLYFIFLLMLKFMEFHGIQKRKIIKSIEIRLQSLRDLLKSCFMQIPLKCRNKILDLFEQERSFDRKLTWYKEREKALKKFVKTGAYTPNLLPFVLWYVDENRYWCSIDKYPHPSTSWRMEALAKFCAYLDNPVLLQKSVNDEIIDCSTNPSFTQNYEVNVELFSIAAIFHYPIWLNKERTAFVCKNRLNLARLMDFKHLYESIYPPKDWNRKIESIELAKYLKTVFLTDLKYYKQFPCIPNMVYESCQYLKFRDFRNMFLEDANQPESVTTRVETPSGMSVSVTTWTAEELHKIKLKQFMGKEAVERLQYVLFFALRDLCKNNDYSFSEHLKDASWMDSRCQTDLFNKNYEEEFDIENRNVLNLDLTSFTGRAYNPTETAVVLIYSIMDYTKAKNGSPYISLINFIDSQREKVFPYYKEHERELRKKANSGEHKKLLESIYRMESIDNGFPIRLSQVSPTFDEQYFERDVTCKVFHESDAKWSHIENGRVKILDKSEYYKIFDSCMLDHIYLNEARNMETHYARFKRTETLLNLENKSTLLQLLTILKSGNKNRSELANCITQLSKKYIQPLNYINFTNFMMENVDGEGLCSDFYYAMHLLDGCSDRFKYMVLMDIWNNKEWPKNLDDFICALYEVFVNVNDESPKTPEGKIPYFDIQKQAVPKEWMNFYKENVSALTREFTNGLIELMDKIQGILKEESSLNQRLKQSLEQWLELKENGDFSPRKAFDVNEALYGIESECNELLKSRYSANDTKDHADTSRCWLNQCERFYDKVDNWKEDSPYPFEDELRTFLNTMFGVANICKGKDVVNFFDLYGYKSELYLIKVLVQLAQE